MIDRYVLGVNKNGTCGIIFDATKIPVQIVEVSTVLGTLAQACIDMNKRSTDEPR